MFVLGEQSLASAELSPLLAQLSFHVVMDQYVCRYLNQYIHRLS